MGHAVTPYNPGGVPAPPIADNNKHVEHEQKPQVSRLTWARPAGVGVGACERGWDCLGPVRLASIQEFSKKP